MTETPSGEINFDFMEDTTPEQTETQADTQPELQPETQEETNPDDEILDLPLTFLGEEKKVTRSEGKTLLQKGMNYDHVKTRAEAAEAELATLKAERVEQEVANQRALMEAKLTEDGYDVDVINQIVNSHPSIVKAESVLKTIEAEKRDNERRNYIAGQKKALEKAPYFKEIESEIDNLLIQNPQTDVMVAYDYMLGKMMRTGEFEKMKSNASKNAIADMQDKLKRGRNITTDAEDGSVDSSTLDKESMEMTRAFGIDPRIIAKYVKENQKKG